MTPVLLSVSVLCISYSFLPALSTSITDWPVGKNEELWLLHCVHCMTHVLLSVSVLCIFYFFLPGLSTSITDRPVGKHEELWFLHCVHRMMHILLSVSVSCISYFFLPGLSTSITDRCCNKMFRLGPRSRVGHQRAKTMMCFRRDVYTKSLSINPARKTQRGVDDVISIFARHNVVRDHVAM